MDPASGNPRPRFQKAIPASMVLGQTDTLLLVEKYRVANVQGHPDESHISYASEHQATGSATIVGGGTYNYPTSQLHGAGESYNYLFLDGHAEFLNRNATLGLTNTNVGTQTGMWTIRPRD